MKINFTYRKPEERRKPEQKPNPPAGTYNATIYNVSEWTNPNTGKTKLFVNLSIGADFAFGAPFDFNKSYYSNLFSALLDACGIDGETFDGETDALVGKSLIVTLENGQYGLEATEFQKVGSVQTEQPKPQNFDYTRMPGFIGDAVDNEPPF